MITGEIKNKIDQIWDTFFVAGITNPITVLEQMTYIFFMKMLDDKQLQEEENARDFDGEVQNPTFPEGQLWINPDATTDEEKAGILTKACAGTCSRTRRRQYVQGGKAARVRIHQAHRHGRRKRLQPLHEVGYLPHSQCPNPYQGNRRRGFSRYEQP